MFADMIQVQPGNVEVSSIASRVSNGEVVSNVPIPLLPYPESDKRHQILCGSALAPTVIVTQFY